MVYLRKKSLAINSFWKDIQIAEYGPESRLRKIAQMHILLLKLFLHNLSTKICKLSHRVTTVLKRQGGGKSSVVHCTNQLRFSNKSVRKLKLQLFSF